MNTQPQQTVAMGRSQKAVRDHNERLVLSILMQQGAMPGSDLARATGLSAQAVSMILRRLEQDGLLERGEPQRGKVGKPSVPMGLACDGAYSIGLKIGRRSADCVLTDFKGHIRQQRRITYRYPMPDPILAFLDTFITALMVELPEAGQARISGIGIATPFEIWSWHDHIGAPQAELDQWRSVDFAARIAQFSNLPVTVDNDATAASRAEHIHGHGRHYRDYAYFFVGFFIGGGVILNHSVFEGAHGYAGAFGPLPTTDPDGRAARLLDTASLGNLEAMVVARGFDPETIWSHPQDWTSIEPVLAIWIDETAAQLAQAAITVCAVIEFEAIVIDGGFPPEVRNRLVTAVRANLDNLDVRGVVRPEIVEGSIGPDARALGAATAPILGQYLIDAHVR